MEFRSDIQGLRALAVIMVFIFHLSEGWLPGGFIGVDIFFVISGYLVSSLILYKVEKGNFTLISFYESRIKRIVPAYYFVLLFTAICAILLFSFTDIYPFRKALLWSFIFNSNNYFATLDNYFGTASSENPLLHTWTLAVEMQFYFLLPILLLRVRNRRLLVLVLLSFIVSLMAYGTYNVLGGDKGVMYFSLPARIPEFLIGVLVAVLGLRDIRFVKNNSLILSTLGFITLLACALTYSGNTPFPGITALLPCIGTVLILIASDNKVNDVFENKIFVLIGELSYSIYLWHWPVMAFFRYNNGIYELSGQEKITIILLVLILSSISYYLIEGKLRKLKGFRFYFPLATFSAVIVGLVYFSVIFSEKLQGDFKEYYAPTFGLDSHGSSFKQVGILGDSAAGSADILLIGDSHALSMKNYFDILGKRNNFKVKTVTNNVYPTIPGIKDDEFDEIRYRIQYSNLIDHVNRELENTKLILVQFTGDGMRWNEVIDQLISNLNNDQKIIFISDFPILNKNPARLNRSVVKDKSLSQKYIVRKSELSADILNKIQSSSKCKLINLSGSVFEDIPFYNDTLMYYDSGHLNIYGSTVYALSTEEEFMKALEWGLNRD